MTRKDAPTVALVVDSAEKEHYDGFRFEVLTPTERERYLAAVAYWESLAPAAKDTP